MRKKILVILFLIMVIISALIIVSTYARYKNELNGQYTQELGKWKIRVNGIEVSTETEEVNIDLNDSIKYADSSVVREGIAPESEAYFELEIDPTILNNATGELDYTDVSIKYNITVENDSEDIYIKFIEPAEGDNYFSSNVSDENIPKVNNDLIHVNTEESIYTGVFPLEKIKNGNKNLVRVRFKCENTVDISELEKLRATIHINFIQYMGEEL